jgi:Spy/CpxP family protein refolding chaperone
MPDWAGHGYGPQKGCDMPRHGHHHDDEGAMAFGVRRPLRFLAHKLDLDEKQVTAMARILDELKTERAQAAVDDRRSLAEFADAVSGETFDVAKATSGGDRRVQSATRLRDAVVRALQEIHALLSVEQRERLAYLLRTGILAV